VVAGERLAELPLLDAERMRIVSVPVENARNEPLIAQAARGRASARLPRLHLQLDSLASHFRRRSVPTASYPPQMTVLEPGRPAGRDARGPRHAFGSLAGRTPLRKGTTR